MAVMGPLLRVLFSASILFLAALASGCYAGAVGVVLGIVLLSDSGSDGNSRPFVSDLQVVTDSRTSPIAISFRISDADSDRADVDIFFMIAAGTFRAALTCADRNLKGLATEPGGLTHERCWDFASQPELGEGFRSGVTLIVRVAGGNEARLELKGTGNDAPELEIEEEISASARSGNVAVPILLSDTSGDIVSVFTSFRVEGESWRIATPSGQPLSVRTDCLEEPPESTRCAAIADVRAREDGSKSRLIFFWDSLADVGHRRAGVEVRLRAHDGLKFGSWQTIAFTIDNNQAPSVGVFALSDTSFEIPLRFIVDDIFFDEGEGHPAIVILQWAEEGQSPPALPGDPEALSTLLLDPQARRAHHILTEAPVSLRGTARVVGGDSSPVITEEDRFAGDPRKASSGLRLDPAARIVPRPVAESTVAFRQSGSVQGDGAGRPVLIKDTRFVRDGLVFLPPLEGGLRPLPPFTPFGRSSEVFLIGQQIRFLTQDSAPGQWLEIEEFDPVQSTIRATGPIEIRSGAAAYELQLRAPIAALSSRKNIYTFIWDSLTDLAAAHIPRDARVRIEARALDSEMGPPGFLDLQVDSSFLRELDPLSAPAAKATAIGDLNGDGGPDVALAFDNRVEIHLLGSSAPAIAITAESIADVAVGDVDGDPLDDLVVASRDRLLIRLQGREDQLPIETMLEGTPGALAVGDLDNDGQDEIVATIPEDDLVLVFRLAGGSIEPLGRFSTGDGPRSVVLGDLDGDGFRDMAVACNNIGSVPVVNVFSGPGKGGVSEVRTIDGFPPRRSSPEALAVGDLTGDGLADLVVVTSSNNAVVLAQTEDTHSLVLYATLDAGVEARSAAVADVDGDRDGNEDLLILDSSGTLIVYLQSAIGTEGRFPTLRLPTGILPVSLAAGDIDGDRRSDAIVASTEHVSVYHQTLPGEIPEKPTEVIRPEASGHLIATGDINGDGRKDILVGQRSGEGGRVQIFLQSLRGSFPGEPPLVLTLEDEPAAVVVADLDADGKNDVGVAERGGTISMFRQGHGGSLDQPRRLFPVDPTALATIEDLAAGDLNDDGKNDLVLVQSNPAGVRVLFQGIGGNFSEVLELANPGNQPRGVAVGDLDGDALNDVVAAVEVSGELQLYFQRERLAPGPAVEAGSPGPVKVHIGDVTGDGANDLIASNVVGVGVFRQDRVQGSFSKLEEVGGSSNHPQVSLGELNGDDALDIVLASNQIDLRIFYSGEEGKLGLCPEAGLACDPSRRISLDGFPVPAGRPLATDDLNGDGRTDVVISLVNNTVQVFLGL